VKNEQRIPDDAVCRIANADFPRHLSVSSLA
jgi:hypothetical protein